MGCVAPLVVITAQTSPLLPTILSNFFPRAHIDTIALFLRSTRSDAIGFQAPLTRSVLFVAAGAVTS